MKKLLFVILVLSMAFNMFAAEARISTVENHAELLAARNGISSQPFTSNNSLSVPNGVSNDRSLLSEGFEGAAFPPAGWVTRTPLNPPQGMWSRRLNDSWGAGSIPAEMSHEGVAAAFSRSWAGDPLNPNNYLITPQLSIPTSPTVLSFYFRTANGGDWGADQLSIYVSTTGNQIADFSQPAIFNETGPAGGIFFTQRVVSLDAYAGQSIYIAFRHHDSYDNDFLGLDTVLVFVDSEEVQPATLVAPENNALVQPNVTLEWAASIVGGAPTGYKVHLGTAANPPLVHTINSATQTTYQANNLLEDTQYYWQIIPFNADGDAEGCPVWTFTTLPDGIVQVGNGSTVSNIPVDIYWNFSYSQMLYLQSQINHAGLIEQVSFYWNGGPSGANNKNWVIYMGHSTITEFSAWIPHSGNNFTQVFNGIVPLPATTGWVTIPLNTPFEYNNTQNLVIATNQITTGWVDPRGQFISTSYDTARSRVVVRDSAVIDIANLPTSVSQGDGAIGNLITAANLLIHFPTSPSLENDLAAGFLTGPNALTVDKASTFSFTVENLGTETANGYSVRLMHGTTQLASQMGVAIVPGGNNVFSLSWTPTAAGEYDIYGEIVWTADMDPSNNQSEELTVNVFEEGGMFVYIGDPNTTSQHPDLPFSVDWQTTLSQTMYYASDIPMYGAITSIQYSFFGVGDIESPREAKIWMAVTDQESFEENDSWIPYSEFSLVYEGPVGLNVEGLQDILIELDNPFAYGGGNLVIMTTRPRDPIRWNWNNRWLCTHPDYEDSRLRSIWSHSDNEDFDPENPPTNWPYRNRYYPNISLFFSVDGLGAITGTVNSGGSPVPDATIRILGTGRSTTSNAQGQYTMDYLFPGEYDLQATKVGFNPSINWGIEVFADQTSTSNFNMSAIQTYNVTGTVTRSDTGLPLAGASVLVTGYAAFPAVETNASGQFTVTGVFAGQNYSATVSAEYYDTKVVSFEMGFNNTNIGDIELYETIKSPTNLVATVEWPNVNLRWTRPDAQGGAVDPVEIEFSHAGAPATAVGADNVPNGSYFAALHRYNATHLSNFGVTGNYLTHIGFITGNQNVAQVEYDIVVYYGPTFEGLDAFDPNIYLESPPAGAFEPETWYEIALPEPVLIQPGYEFVFGMLCFNMGPTGPVYPFVMDAGPAVQGYGNVSIVQTGFGVYSIPRNTVLYAIASNVVTGSTTTIGTSPWTQNTNPIKLEYARNSVVSTSTFTSSSFISNPYSRQIRLFESYNIYRSLASTSSDPDTWVTLATNHTETTFSDNSWETLNEYEVYRYLVTAVYTHDIESNPVVSNSVINLDPSIVYLGDPGSDQQSLALPFNYNFWTGVSQTIYLNDELPIGGYMEKFTFRFNGSGNLPPGINVRFWYAVVHDKDVFADAYDWVPYDQFTLIYEGSLPVSEAGEYLIDIVPEKPILYGTGNIVFMSERQKEPDGAWHPNNWWHVTGGEAYQNRTLSLQRDSESYEIENLYQYEWASLSDRIPNIMIKFNSEGLGHITGTVTGGTPATAVNGARISLDGDLVNIVYSNAQGQYTMPYVPVGGVTISASALGFYNYQSPNLSLSQGQTLTHPINMTMLPQISVTGRILSSHDNGPLANANVALTGYVPLGPVKTDSQGQFTIPGVFANNVYDIVINANAHDELIVPISVLGVNYNAGDITLWETAYPATNVLAEIEGGNVVVTWEAPEIPDEPVFVETWFSHAVGTELEEAIQTEGGGAHALEAVHRYSQAQLQTLGVSGAELTKMAVYFYSGATNPSSGTYTLLIYTGGSAGPFNPGTLAYSQPIPAGSFAYNAWNEFELNTPFLIPTTGEMWIGYGANVTAGAPSAVTDYLTGGLTNFGDVLKWGTAWQTLTAAGLSANWMIRGQAMVEGEAVMISPLSYTQEELQSDVVASSRSEFGVPRLAAYGINNYGFTSSSSRHTDLTITTRENRGLLGYNVYRANAAHLADTSLWTQIATNTTALTVTDNAWNGLDFGNYVYMVETVFSNNNFADPALSNVLTRMPADFVYIGNPESTHTSVQIPFNLGWRSSLAQTIYLQEEIYMIGKITDLIYTFNSGGAVDEPKEVTFYMANVSVDRSSFNDAWDWHPFDQFVQVYKGFLPFNLPAGTYQLIIPLDTPFEYEGENIIIYSQRHQDPTNWWYGDSFQTTEVENNRSVNAQQDNVDFNPAELPPPTWPGATNAIPNIGLVFSQEGMGTVAGHITSNGNPVAGAEITIKDTSRTTLSDEEGYYELGFIIPGVIGLSVSRFGYSDTEVDDIVILADQITTVDIEMEMMANTSVAGRVMASDTDGPLEGASVMLTGFDTFQTETGADGRFTFPNVFSGYTYTLTVSKPRYGTHINNNVVVGDTPVVIPDITLEENIIPPSNVVAQIQGDYVHVTWNAPVFDTATRADDSSKIRELPEPQKRPISNTSTSPRSADNSATRFEDAFAGLTTGEVMTKNQRILLGYTVYRSLKANEDNPAAWVMVAPEVVELEFTDESWADIETDGVYVYLVRAKYSKDNYSDAIKSNDVNKVVPVYDAPRNFTATLVNDKDVRLNWEAPALGTPTGYKLYRNNPENVLAANTTLLQYLDADPGSGNHTYFIVALYPGGIESDPVSADIFVDINDTPIPPAVTALKNNYPNPFNPSTTIAFELATEGNVKIDIFNIRGQKVHTLVNDVYGVGRFTVEWKGVDDAGKSVSSGVYFYQMATEGFSDIRRMVLMK